MPEAAASLEDGAPAEVGGAADADATGGFFGFGADATAGRFLIFLAGAAGKA